MVQPLVDNWQSLEVWIDPTASPPYVLMLLWGDDGLWHVLDPAKEYRSLFASRSYEEARHWLLEDEYEHPPSLTRVSNICRTYAPHTHVSYIMHNTRPGSARRGPLL